MLFALKDGNTTGSFQLCSLFYKFIMVMNLTKYVYKYVYTYQPEESGFAQQVHLILILFHSFCNFFGTMLLPLP